MPFSGVHIVWFILYVVLPISSGPASRIGIFWDGEYFNNLQTTNSFWHSTKRLASFLSNWMVFRFVHHMCLRIWIPKRPVVTSSVLWSVLFPGQLKSLTSFPPFQQCGKNVIIFLPLYISFWDTCIRNARQGWHQYDTKFELWFRLFQKYVRYFSCLNLASMDIAARTSWVVTLYRRVSLSLFGGWKD